MNTIKETNNQTTVNSNSNNITSIFCSMPIEIIDHICRYLDLRSILNTSETCKTLNFYLLSILPLDQIKKIYSNKAYFFINKNIDFINNSNKLLVKHLNHLTEEPSIKNNAISSMKASKLYGLRFALLDIMSEGCYRFNKVDELNINDLPNVDEFDYFSCFHATHYYNEYLLFVGNKIYLINLDENENENKIKDLKYIVNIKDFVKFNFHFDRTEILIKDEFIIIIFYKHSIIFKKDQDTYSSITPKAIETIYNKTFLILKDSSNQPYFLICLNDKVYQCDEQQLVEISINPEDIDCNVKDITPEGLIVYSISSSENGKLILFYGRNSINQKQIELHVQFNGEIIKKISCSVDPYYFDIDKKHQFICSPTGTSFTIKNIIIGGIKTVLYKISDNKLNKIKIEKADDVYDSEYEISYEGDDLLKIDGNYSHTLVFVPSAYSTRDDNYINKRCMYKNYALWMGFNQTKNIYALYNDKLLSPQYINNESRDNLCQIRICTIKNKNINSSIIDGIQEVNQIVFSPNSQLVVINERYTLRAYRIIKKNNDGDLIFLKNAELIAGFVINENIENFHFHMSGFKIIVHTDTSIKILNLEKDLN